MTKILHILNHSKPHTDGYSVRSAEIVRFQKKLGFDPVVLTSPRQEPPPTCEREIIDTIPYFRVFQIPKRKIVSRVPLVRHWSELRCFSRRILGVIDEVKPDVVHAHSPCHWGKAALKAARRRSLPFVYEIRGFWEDCIIDNGGNPNWSLKYRLGRKLESQVVNNADAVVTISQGLRDDLVSRGLSHEKMFLVPNGVDVERFPPLQMDLELRKQLGLNGHTCLGYLGSFYNWEGIDDLVRAMSHLVTTTPQARLLLVGGGKELNRIDQMIDELNLRDSVHLVGPVSREEVSRYYSVMDVLVYPRKRSRTTELTTPLKPLEAMCMGKPIIASNVGGLRELFPESAHGIRYFESENLVDLADACGELVRADDMTRTFMGKRVREHALAERRWEQIVADYREVYDYASSQAANGRDKSCRTESDIWTPSPNCS